MDPNSVVGKIALGVIRHFIVGAFATGSLYLDKSDQAAGVTAAMTLIAILASAYDKIQSHKQLQAAQGAQP